MTAQADRDVPPSGDAHHWFRADGMTLEVVRLNEQWAEPWAALALDAALQRLVETIALRFDAPGHASLALSDDNHVAGLNAQFRGAQGPTNVLAFPSAGRAREHEFGADTVGNGDVVVAVETLAREAKRDAKAFEQHFVHLVLHGLLHLYGFDHITPQEASEMEAEERAILAQLGIPDPYNDDDFELG